MPERRASGLIFAAGLSLAFLLCSTLPAITGGLWGRFGDQVLNTALTEPLWRMRLGHNIAVFLTELVALHFCVGAFCWVMGVTSQTGWPRVRGSRRQWILLWFIASIFWILTANAAAFPNTMLGFPYHALATTRAAGLSVFAWTTLIFGAAALITLAAAMAHSATCRRLALGGITAGAATIAVSGWTRTHQVIPKLDQPNIILIGIDSLRIDGADPSRMPHVHAFLDQASVAEDAITPLARTFPAWASILTGRNPHTTGAFMNLLPREQVDTGETLPATLRAHGYRSAYAIDETRFSNIDETYGFDQVVTPPMGASDFVLGTFADIPLLNLITNTRLGGWLFPHIHGNRAAFNLYEPDTFVRRLDRELSYDKPLFLATHLTLPHWPYTWATSSLEPEDGPTQLGHYLDTLRRVDQQFGQLMQALDKRGALENALVIVLSDHGQAFAGDETLVVPGGEQLSHITNFDTEGHGTSVFSPMQYRVVLSFRGYGPMANALRAPAPIPVPMSLIDIAPTVLDLLEIDAEQSVDGISIAPLLRRNGTPLTDTSDRVRFTETEYRPAGLSEDRLTSSGVREAIRVYQVDPQTDRVTVKTDSLDKILETRQYAAFLGNRAFAAAIPEGRKGGTRRVLYVSHPFGPDAATGEVSQKDRTILREALENTFSITVADR